MGLVARVMEQRAVQWSTLKDPAQWLVDWFGGAVSGSGVRVTAQTSRRITAVWSAVKILAESIASLPIFVMQRSADGKGREKLLTDPLHPILHDQPNLWQTSLEWREMMQGHLCLRGNAYSEIFYDRRGSITALIPRHPDRILVYDLSQEEIGDQPLVYEYTPLRGGPSRFIFADEMLHLKGLSDDGLVGLSPIQEFKETLGLAIGTESYAARFFGNYANPGGVLSHPKTLSKDAVARLRAQWEEKHQGVENAHRVAVLEEGLSWTAIGVNPRDSQLLDSRKFSVTEIARIFRVPPHKLGDLDRASFANIEQQAIEFVVDTLRPWIVRWEQRLGISTLTPAERKAGKYIKLSVDALLRGDIRSRYASYATGRQWGWLSPNEVRELEDMNPRTDPGGDAYNTPLNMSSSEDPAPAITAAADPTPPQGQDPNQGGTT